MKMKPTTKGTTKISRTFEASGISKSIGTPEAKADRKQRIAQDKPRAKSWAEARKLRANPIEIAQEVAVQRIRSSPQRIKGSSTSSTIPAVSYSTMDNEIHASAILSDLQRKRDKLAHELEEIDLAIQVINKI